MRLHEVITPEADRPGSRLQPKRHGAALIRRASVRLPDDLDFVVMPVNRFGFAGRIFKPRVHWFENLIGTPFRNHEASLSSKLNQVRVDGEPNNSSDPSFTPGVVLGHDEFTKPQG